MQKPQSKLPVLLTLIAILAVAAAYWGGAFK
jgi:hypothetical protein